MSYQEGLIRVKLGTFAQEGPDVRREHFQRAIQIFEKMGAVYELEVAKRLEAGESRL